MTRPSRKPGDLERIDDYVRGVGTEADAEGFEEDLFARAIAGEADDLVTFDAFVSAFRRQAERGTFMNYITEGKAEELRARYGERIVFREMKNATERQHVVLPAKAEFLLSRCVLDLRGVDRLDVEAIVEGVGTVKVMPDVTFDPQSGAVWGFCEMDLAIQTAGMTLLSKYWGHGPGGKRLVGENYVVVEVG